MDAAIDTQNRILFKRVIEFLDGAFDNFQQAWQENTEEDIHRLEVEQKHRHIHTIFEKDSASTNDSVQYVLKHIENRNNENVVGQHYLKIAFDPLEKVITSTLKTTSHLTENIIWRLNGTSIEGISANENTVLKLEGNQLDISQKEGFFKNSLPYRMLKCRFFSGWIEFPNPENPEDVYRMGDLKMHDQGDMIPLTFKDGTRGIYTVELTQLVFAKTLHIMKLSIYDEPKEQIHYSSKAMTYIWTNPEAKRIGINLRKVLTGWTFIEPGFVSSNNMDLEDK